MSILSVAQSQIGIKESPRNSNRVKYSQWYGLTGPWCDMFVSWCANQAGVGNVVGKYAYCPSHVNYFKSKGWWHNAEYKPQPGDIIFFASHGTACHVGIVERRNGSYSVTTIEGNTSVSSNDNGGAVMRRVRTYGNPYGSWGILGFAHPPYNNGNGRVSAPAARSWLQKGDKGQEVKNLQSKLIALGYSCGKSGADGDFGTDTLNAVKRFQQNHGLVVDGEAGVNTMAKINALLSSKSKPGASSAHYDAWIAALQKECNRQGYSRQAVDGVAGPATLAGCPTVKQGARGGITRLIQQRLISLGYPCGRSGADGDFGPGTRAAVRVFQQKRGLAADGIVGKNTWRKLLGKSKPAATASHYDAWVAALQKECNRQGYSHQTVDGIAGPATLRGCPTLKIGAKGNITRLMQQRLIAWGYPCGRCGADGDFGVGTRNAVIAFQKKRGLTADGIVGRNTWRKLLWLKF